MATVTVSSVDWSWRMHARPENQSAEKPTKYHIPRAEDWGLALCSTHVLLNEERLQRETTDSNICRRCLRIAGLTPKEN